MIKCSDCKFESHQTRANFTCIKCGSDRVFLIEEELKK
jgi:Zn finger protein HypA/HybF involved in hydrogenase expression